LVGIARVFPVIIGPPVIAVVSDSLVQPARKHEEVGVSRDQPHSVTRVVTTFLLDLDLVVVKFCNDKM
jgi:hypothetical protein